MTRRFIILTATLAGLLAAGGCGDGEAEREATPQDPGTGAATTTLPAIPGVDEAASASDGLLVKPGPPRKRQQTYALDESADKGALRVICRIPSVRVALPAPTFVDFSDPAAIKDPQTVEPYKVIYDGIRQRGYDITNEVEFYKNWNPPRAASPLNWLAPQGDGLAVNAAAIVVQGVKAGSREELNRGRALLNHRYRQGNYIRGQNNYSGYNIAFAPPNDRVMIGSGDHFPCEIAFTDEESGEPFGHVAKLRPLPFKREGMYAGWLLRANPGSATQPRPLPGPSPTFRKTGIYGMRCRRHSWHVGYVVVADNPYVAVSGAQRAPWVSNDGKVTIAGIPPGVYKVRIWHPLVAPVKELHEVTIERDETTHLIVDFKPPTELLDLAK